MGPGSAGPRTRTPHSVRLLRLQGFPQIVPSLLINAGDVSGGNLVDAVLLSTPGGFVCISHLQTERPDGNAGLVLRLRNLKPWDRPNFACRCFLIAARATLGFHSAESETSFCNTLCIYGPIGLQVRCPGGTARDSIFRLRPKETLLCVAVYLFALAV